MSDPGCDRQVREAQRRLDELTHKVGRIAQQEPLVGEAMRELSTALQELRAAADDMNRWLKAGRLKARIDRVLPLARAAEAHALLERNETVGKVVLAVSAAD